MINLNFLLNANTNCTQEKNIEIDRYWQVKYYNIATDKMNVLLKNGTTNYNIDFGPNDDLDNIISKLSIITKVPKALIKLEYNGRTINTNNKNILIKHVGIKNGSVVLYNYRLFTEEYLKSTKDDGY